MKIITKLDSIAIFTLVLHLFLIESSILIFFLFLFLPDITFLGYILGNKWGAIIYNFVHHKLLGLFLYLFGLNFDNKVMILLGLIIIAHSAMDHSMGYGFKTFKGFKHTSLGKIV